MNRTSSHAQFGFTRRGFFAATIGALVASVLPAKAEVTCPAQIKLEEGDRRTHRAKWEYWDGKTWVPLWEERCTSDDKFCHDHYHFHPGGDRSHTHPLPDDRYPTAIWDKNGVQKNPEWDAWVKSERHGI